MAKPALKWAGGKRWLAPRLRELARSELRGTYYELFAGGAACFFDLEPAPAVLNDSNAELINCYRVMRDRPEELLRRVWRHSNTRECYDRVRVSRPRTDLTRAVKFLYLNRTCWGGLYRVNRDGEFNVPFANSGRAICRGSVLRAASAALQGAELVAGDFAAVATKAGDGDVVFADPPYVTAGAFDGFRRYNEAVFSWEDQERLAASAGAAAARGVFVMVTGVPCDDVFALYPGWMAMVLERRTNVAGRAEHRGVVSEVVLLSRRPAHVPAGSPAMAPVEAMVATGGTAPGP